MCFGQCLRQFECNINSYSNHFQHLAEKSECMYERDRELERKGGGWHVHAHLCPLVIPLSPSEKSSDPCTLVSPRYSPPFETIVIALTDTTVAVKVLLPQSRPYSVVHPSLQIDSASGVLIS